MRISLVFSDPAQLTEEERERLPAIAEALAQAKN
jgi:hypothetical protein